MSVIPDHVTSFPGVHLMTSSHSMCYNHISVSQIFNAAARRCTSTRAAGKRTNTEQAGELLLLFLPLDVSLALFFSSLSVAGGTKWQTKPVSLLFSLPSFSPYLSVSLSSFPSMSNLSLFHLFSSLPLISHSPYPPSLISLHMSPLCLSLIGLTLWLIAALLA